MCNFFFFSNRVIIKSVWLLTPQMFMSSLVRGKIFFILLLKVKLNWFS